MKKILVSVLSSCLLASALSAVSFKEDSLKVSFEGYKTKERNKDEKNSCKCFKFLLVSFGFKCCIF
ncbi:hypothetical protein IGC40_000330 [Campylobacter jejuni]|nr:hypothetical protein [Campylobacter jejuni]EIE0705697.1 hypothetical protein [Campylobacter jejuni]